MGMDPRERAFAHELAYGVSRLQGRLDHLLGRHVHRGLDSVRPDVLEGLRQGAYQLLYMDGVPRYAAISETVERTKQRAGKGAGGLTNAVLRRTVEDGDDKAHFPDPDHDPVGFLSSWGSHPRWLVERWLARWTVEEVARLVTIDNQRPAVHLVPLDCSPTEAEDRLAAAGVVAAGIVRRARGAESISVLLPPGTSVVDALAAVPGSIIQDPAAHLVTRYADPAPGTKVADLCAAPGGKSMALSRTGAYTLAADRSETRMRMVRQNAERTRSRVGCVVADARRPPLREIDAVLLDVPCTGTGTLARHPDARWRLRPESVMEMAAVQGELLEAAAPVVAPGGLLVYSTCSLEREENEDRVHDFLSRHPEFRIEPTESVPSDLRDDSGCLVVTPQGTGFDGSFAARLVRIA